MGRSIKPERWQGQESHLVVSFHFKNEEIKAQGSEVTRSRLVLFNSRLRFPTFQPGACSPWLHASDVNLTFCRPTSWRAIEAFPLRPLSLSQGSCAQIKPLYNYSLFESMRLRETIYYQNVWINYRCISILLVWLLCIEACLIICKFTRS